MIHAGVFISVKIFEQGIGLVWFKRPWQPAVEFIGKTQHTRMNLPQVVYALDAIGFGLASV